MIRNIEREIRIGSTRYPGIKELGFDSAGALVLSMYTTPGPEPRGSWFTTIPISSMDYREAHPTQARMAKGNGCLVIFDDYGKGTRIEAGPDLLEQLMLDCHNHKVFNEAEGFSEGFVVRVRRPGDFTSALAKKVSNRDAVVESVFVPIGSTTTRIRVRFLKRNGRGKEFTHMFLPSDLVMA